MDLIEFFILLSNKSKLKLIYMMTIACEKIICHKHQYLFFILSYSYPFPYYT